MTLKLSIFGNLSIQFNEAPVKLTLRKAETLLYYVALNGRTPRDELKSIFWHDKNDARASANLRNAIYLINEAMPGVLETDKRHISVSSFETDLNQTLPIKDIRRSIPPLIFYTPLKDMTDTGAPDLAEWINTERLKVRTYLLDLLRERLSAAYDIHNETVLEETLKAILALDPCDEDSVLELMELYAGTGRSYKAAEIFQEFDGRIKSLYCTFASDRARSYYEKLLYIKNDQNAAEKFWCRGKELDAIRHELASHENKKVVYVHGEAGIGKTALINSVLGSAAASECVVLSSRGTSICEGYDYASWNNVISALGSALESAGISLPPRSISFLSGIFPGFMKEKGFSFNADISMMTEISSSILAVIIAEALRSLTERRSVILVLEDLHRFDIRSVELLESLISLINPIVKIIISSRPESEKYVTQMLRRHAAPYLDIRLGPFSREEILYISRSTLPSATIESRGASYFVSESEGIPLMLFEMLRLLSEDPESDCASGLGSLILERMDKLTDEERSVLVALSVCISGSPDLIAETAGLAKDKVISAAEVLMQKGMIEEGQSGGTPLWSFTHQKVRECVSDSITLSKKQELHRRAAASLERRYSRHVWDSELSAAIRRHFVMAGEKTLELKQYLRELVLDVTLNHDVFPTLPDRLLLSCSAPFSSRNETERKISKALDILDNLSGDGTVDRKEYQRLEAECFEIIGDYMISWGEYDKGQVYIKEAEKAAKRSGMYETSVYCLKHLAYMYLQTENSVMLMNTSRELIRTALDASMPQYAATAIRHIGIAYLMKLDFSRAEKIFLYSIELFERLRLTGKHYTLGILVAKCYLGEIYQRRGELARASTMLKECTSTCEQMNLYWGRSYFLAIAADIAFDMNDMDSFYTYVDEGVALFECYKGGRCGYKLYSLKAIADIERNDFIGAKYAIEKAAILVGTIHRDEGFAIYHLAKAWDEESDALIRMSEAIKASSLYRKIGFDRRAEWIENKFSSFAI